MLGFLLTLLIVISISFSVYRGDTQVFANCISEGTKAAISLCISLAGSMAFWGGILKLMDNVGATQGATLLFMKPLRKLFRGIDNDETIRIISLNITANMLGMGNAAFPLALTAMKRLKAEDGCSGRNTALFIIFNTASVQLIPFTTAALRSRHGAEKPLDILPASLVVSASALIAGVIVCCVFFPRSDKQ